MSAERAVKEERRQREESAARHAAQNDWRTEINQISKWQEYNLRQQERQRERNYWRYGR